MIDKMHITCGLAFIAFFSGQISVTQTFYKKVAFSVTQTFYF